MADYLPFQIFTKSFDNFLKEMSHFKWTLQSQGIHEVFRRRFQDPHYARNPSKLVGLDYQPCHTATRKRQGRKAKFGLGTHVAEVLKERNKLVT